MFSSMVFNRILAGVFVVGCVAGASAISCSDPGANRLSSSSGGEPPPTDTCALPGAGCACSTEGESKSCGVVKQNYGSYVSCQMGTQTCSGGKWGACSTDRVAFKSLPASNEMLRAMGLGQAAPCAGLQNACDPACQSFEGDDSNGVDAGADGGLAKKDGGFTLGEVPAACQGLQCNVPKNCAGPTAADGTTLIGIIRDPAGVSPVNRAVIYIPNDPSYVLPTIPDGPIKDACGGAGQLPPSIASAVTSPNGSFTLKNVPVGVSMKIIIQTGKWRRAFDYTVPAAAACAKTDFESTAALKDLMRLPRTEERFGVGEGHIPRIAVVNSGCEAIDCMLRKIGIDESEFGVEVAGDATRPGRVHLYRANGHLFPGHTVPNRAALLDDGGTRKLYDTIMLPCDCGSEYNNTPDSERTNLSNYADEGGRAMASHWGREWVERGKNNHASSATWVGSQTFDWFGYAYTGSPEGIEFRDWLIAAGVTTAAQPSFTLANGTGRLDNPSINPAISKLWVYGANVRVNPSPNAPSAGSPGIVGDYTFDTPVAPGPKFGRVMFTSMHLSETSGSTGASSFPSACNSNPMSGQEKAFEFLFNDLGACLNVLPPPVVTFASTASFDREFSAACPAGKRVVWNLFEWQSALPAGTGIEFKARTAQTAAGLATAQVVNLANVVPPGSPLWTGVSVDSKLRTASPSQQSAEFLRISMVLNASADRKNAPTLLGWRQGFACVDAE